MPSENPRQHTSAPTLATTVQCMGCGSDITPRSKRAYAHCRPCEDATGFEPFERGQQVKVPDSWVSVDGEDDLSGCRGFITGRFTTGAFEVALRPEGWEAAQPFCLFEYEIEAIS